MPSIKRLANIIKSVLSLGFVTILRTVYFNFKYLSFRTAIHLPVIVTAKIIVSGLHRGGLIIEKPHFGSVTMGPQKYSFAPKFPSFLHVEGIMRIKGSGFHLFNQGFIITVYPNACLEVGDNFSVAPNLKMTVTNRVVVGENNMWSYQEIVMDSDIHTICDMDGNQINRPGQILFGNDVWLGARCTVLKNVSIAHDVVIGSSSIITKSITKSLDIPNSIYAGCPPRVVKSNIKWKRDFIVSVLS